MLLGRSAEQRRVRHALEAAESGQSGALMIVGEPGIGKTSLLESAADRAGDFIVLRTRGTESEAELPFAGLADLLSPISPYLDDIPEPQAAALRAALAIGPQTAFDPFTTFVGTLSLLATAAEHQPVLVLVDDAHWLDRSSQNAILFAARRLEAERIAMLVAMRPEAASPLSSSDLPVMVLGGLDGRYADQLLRRGVSAPVSDEVASQLVSATGGNPLALLEIPRLLSTSQLHGDEGLPDPLPLGADLRQLFLGRMAHLPHDTRRGLLVAAVSSSENMAEITPALLSLGLDVRVLEPAEAAGIVTIGQDLQFTHPLVRASIYYDARPGARREVHAAMAAGLKGPDSAARRAWHLAAATIGQDEDVARAVEEAAEHARQRGAHAVAAKTFERAGGLSLDPVRRASRLLAAAAEYQLAGQSNRSLGLLDAAGDIVTDPLALAEMEHLRGRILMSSGPLSVAHQVLADAAHAIQASHPLKAAHMLSDGSLACFIAGRSAVAESLSRQAFELTGRRDDQAGESIHLLFTGMLVLTGNAEEAREHVKRERRRIAEMQAAGQWQPIILGAIWLMWAEEHSLAAAVLDAGIDEARRLGALGFLPLPLAQRAELAWRAGDWAVALASSSEAVRLAEDTGQTVILSYAQACLSLALAGMGRDAECRASAAAAMDEGRKVGSESTFTRVEAALGLMELGAGKATDAARHLSNAHKLAQAHGIGEPTVVPYAGDLIEALLRAGRHREAEDILEQLSQRAVQGGRLWTNAIASRARGLMASEDDFETHFLEALGWHKRLPARFDHARTLLAFGERLRRSGQRLLARDRLREALEEFERMGAVAWAARARAELRATGEAVAGAPRAGIRELTPQELQIALAVAAGATNREVAASLFLSPKTVEFHLGNVYSKLAIRSRTQLVRVVAGNA